MARTRGILSGQARFVGGTVALLGTPATSGGRHLFSIDGLWTDQPGRRYEVRRSADSRGQSRRHSAVALLCAAAAHDAGAALHCQARRNAAYRGGAALHLCANGRPRARGADLTAEGAEAARHRWQALALTNAREIHQHASGPAVHVVLLDRSAHQVHPVAALVASNVPY